MKDKALEELSEEELLKFLSPFRKKPQKQDATPIAKAMSEFFVRNGLATKKNKYAIVHAYHELMGPAITKVTQRVYTNSEGVLFLRLESSTLQEELFNQRTKLIDLLNEKLGEALVKEIRFL